VNTADDDIIHGLHVAADLDTVVYTLAGVEGPHGWGRDGESWRAMEALERFPGADTTFRLGDLDLATNLYRTGRLLAGDTLSAVTADIAAAFGIAATVVPATNDPVRTLIDTGTQILDFQTYFVRRRHADPVCRVTFDGLDRATPAPGVLEAIATADLVVIAPSNPVLSVWPIIGIPGISAALEAATVVAVSPIVAGRAVKGPAVEVMKAMGLDPSPAGIADAYDGLLDGLVVNMGDEPEGVDLPVLATDTMIGDPDRARLLAEEILAWRL
jgi:LPPG:FO 2-phospho-L-lactate transferase